VPRDELARWERDDPIDRYVALLEERRWAGADERAAVDARVARELDAAVDEAEREPLPEPATALEAVYAAPAAQAAAWYREAPRA